AKHDVARTPFEIASRVEHSEPTARSERDDRVLLRVAVLEDQHAAGVEMRRRIGEHAADRVEAVRSAVERRTRLEAEAREMRIVAREIRRVAHDAVERASAQRGEPVGLEPLDVEPEPLAVLARDRERLGARIDAEDDRIAPLVLDRERERTAAGA